MRNHIITALFCFSVIGCVTAPVDNKLCIYWFGGVTQHGTLDTNISNPTLAITTEGKLILNAPLDSIRFRLGSAMDTFVSWNPGTSEQTTGWIDFNKRIVNFLPQAPFSIETPAGKVTADISIPDSLCFLLPLSDTIAINTPVTLQWKHCADYYLINFSYTFYDSSVFEQRRVLLEDSLGFISGMCFDTLVEMPGRYFLHSGVLSVLVIPINGPKWVEPGQKGNLTGDGGGFLFASNSGRGDEYPVVTIVIENGFQGTVARLQKHAAGQKEYCIKRFINYVSSGKY